MRNVRSVWVVVLVVVFGSATPAINADHVAPLLSEVCSRYISGHIPEFDFEREKSLLGIGRIGHDFRQHFGGVHTLKSGSFGEAVTVYRLEKNATDQMILEALGDRAEVPLVVFFTVLLHAGDPSCRGQRVCRGLRLDATNIFYIRDRSGVLWCVRADPHSRDGWLIDVEHLSGPLMRGPWRSGKHIFAH